MSPGDDRLWEMFRREAGERGERMLASLRTVEGGEALGPDLASELHREAHTLKGAAGLMGEVRLYELARLIDAAVEVTGEAGGLQPEAAPKVIEAVEAFRAGVEAGAQGAGPPESVERSIEALSDL